MSGHPPAGGNTPESVSQPSGLPVTLPGPGAVKRERLKIPVIHIQRHGTHLFQPELFSPLISNLHMTCSHIRILEYRIGQHRLKAKAFVPADNLQGFAFSLSRKRSRKARKLLLSLINPVGRIGQCACLMPSLCPDSQCRLPEIPDSVGGIFHGKGIQEGNPVPVVFGGHKGRLLNPQQIAHVTGRNALSIINMSQKPLLVRNPHHVTGMRRIQLKHPPRLIINNTHLNSHSFPFFRTKSPMGNNFSVLHRAFIAMTRYKSILF